MIFFRKSTLSSLLVIVFLLFIPMPLYAAALTIYTEESPPDQFKDKNGNLTGFAVEIVNEIQRRAGTNYPIELVSWARGYHNLQSKPNIILFSISRTKDRNPLFHWVGPLSENVYGFYAKADSKIKISTLDDAKLVKAIGVYTNDVRALYLTEKGFKNLDCINSNTINYKKLMANRIELLACSPTSIESEAKLAGYEAKDFKLVYPFLKVQSYIAFSKNSPPETVKLWNDILESMKKDGSFKTIFKKYFPKDELPGPGINDF